MTKKEFKKLCKERYIGVEGDFSRTPQDIIDMFNDGELDTVSNYDHRTQQDWLGYGTKYYVPAKRGKVTIYRATQGETIRPGDYVTNSKKYAEMHLDSILRGEGLILMIKNIGLDELVVVNPNEFWYAPKIFQASSLDEVYKRLKD